MILSLGAERQCKPCLSLWFIKRRAASVLCFEEGGLILTKRGEIQQTSSSGEMEMQRYIIHGGADTI